jgi:hypothetical protein
MKTQTDSNQVKKNSPRPKKNARVTQPSDAPVVAQAEEVVPAVEPDIKLINKVVDTWNHGGVVVTQYEVEIRNDSFKPVSNVHVRVLSVRNIILAWNAERNGNIFSFPSGFVTSGGLQPGVSFKFGYIIDGSYAPMVSFV